MSKPIHIYKFGGSSLKTPSFIKQSAQLIIDRAETVRPYVVVSALGGVTDTLIRLADTAGRTSAYDHEKIDILREKHLNTLDELAESPDARDAVDRLFDELERTLDQAASKGGNHHILKDRILSIGERASAHIFAGYLSALGHPACACEASNFIRTDATFGEANVQPAVTRDLIRKYLAESEVTPVITGFIGSDDQQRITTLGRSGSDYTAGLLADALEADHLEIWTDVNGVLSADPQWVPNAHSIEELSFTDIGELSAHGARVIHPKTIRPIAQKETSVRVKNSHNPDHPGTLINNYHKSNGSFKTITVTGPFTRISTDYAHSLNLLDEIRQWLDDETGTDTWAYSSQGTYEPAHFLIREPLFRQVEQQLTDWRDAQEADIEIEHDVFKVKKFSNEFLESEDLTSKIWNLLASREIRPLHIERNSNDRYISLLLKRDDAQRAARLMNDYLHPAQKTVDLFIAGTGAVGNTLLQQLRKIDRNDIRFRLLGSCNSRQALWNDSGLNIKEELDWADAESTDWDFLVDRLTQTHRHNLIFVDATGSEEVARLYPSLFSNGVHVVTPSKLANTFEQSFFDKLQLQKKRHNASFRYETTVGAGLPVISTLRNLKHSRDNITEISGVVSGTMTYLFNQIENGVPFSEAVVTAREKGYAEPDPRDDLSGEDVARKFLTLARTLGLQVEREELEVESLIPDKLKDVDQATFLDELSSYDDHWKKRVQQARQGDEVLRYTGKLSDGKITIGIQSIPKSSPIGQLKGTDNLIQIYSGYYNETPLVIQGPGAGKEVTAAGVLSDILKTAEQI